MPLHLVCIEKWVLNWSVGEVLIYSSRDHVGMECGLSKQLGKKVKNVCY